MEQNFQNENVETLMLAGMLQAGVLKYMLDESFTLVLANDFFYNLTGYTKQEHTALYQNFADD